jgi:hypothetical protein
MTDVREAMPALEERAAGYRAAMRELRSPEKIISDFTTQVEGIESR